MNNQEGHHMSSRSGQLGGNGQHHLPRHSSTPSLSSIASSSHQLPLQQNQGFVTPRSSFDSLGTSSLRAAAIPSTNPWGTSSIAVASAAPSNSLGAGRESFEQMNLNSRHNSVLSADGITDQLYRSQPTSSGGGRGSNGFGFDFEAELKNDPNDVKRLSTLLSSSGLSPQRPPPSAAPSVSSQQQQQQQQPPPAFPVGVPPVQQDNSSLHLVDPAIEQAFRNMAKSIDEKDKEIDRLKTEIEAILAATILATGKAVSSEKFKLDGNDMVHRITHKLKSLKQENEYLGQLLSQGRAAQKEVELGVLRREIKMLKSRLAEVDKTSAGTSTDTSSISG